MKKLKDKPCKWCGTIFRQYLSTDQFCSTYCFIDAHKEKVWKKIVKEKKLKLKTRNDYLKDLQKVFNEFIRLRDKDLPCISCGTNKKDIQYHAGHYRSVGSTPELRFNELNCHKQCSKCNNYLSGNLINYRINLIKKIGLDMVEELEKQHEPLKWSIEEINAKIQYYKNILKELK